MERQIGLVGDGIIALCALCISKAHAEERRVDTTLVLALDVSGSVDEARWKVQRQGYANAFSDRRVRDAIIDRPIAVTLFHWADRQKIAIFWRLIDSEASLESLTTDIGKMDRAYQNGSTRISAALSFGLSLQRESGFTARRRIIDISGDGKESGFTSGANDGSFLERARSRAEKDRVIVNGLPILITGPLRDTDNIGIEEYYAEHVISGPGSFIEVVHDGNDVAAFTKALVNKLLRELITDAR